MKNIKQVLSLILVMVMSISSLPINMTVNAEESEVVTGEEVAVAEKVEDDVIDTEIAEAPSTVTERGMQFKIDNLEDVKSIRYAYGEYETERDIKYGTDAVSHSGKTLRNKGNSCTLQFTKPGLVSIVVTYNDGTRDFYKYEVIKSEPTVTRDGGNSITFENLNDLKVLRYVKGEYDNSYDIKRASGSVAISGKTLNSDTYTATLDRETYTFCVQYNDESYNYYVTGICGDNLTWVYDMQTATLTVSGEGEMAEYDYKKYPWSSYSNVAEKLVVSKGVTTISEGAFFNFEMLVDLNLSSTIESIGHGAFDRCHSLISVIIPDSVTWLGGAFEQCANLESVVIGDGINTIGMSTFARCPNLKKVVFGSNIKIIGDHAFTHCTVLDDIDLPDSLKEIGMNAFYATGFYNNKDNWENNVLYIDGHMITTGENDFGTCIIKDGTKSIASCAFEGSYVDVIYIPESVVFIFSGALSTDNYANKRDYTHFMVVKGSYAEQYIIEQYETIGDKYSYSYYNPADIYG